MTILFLDFDGVLHPESLKEAQRDQLFWGIRIP